MLYTNSADIIFGRRFTPLSGIHIFPNHYFLTADLDTLLPTLTALVIHYRSNICFAHVVSLFIEYLSHVELLFFPSPKCPRRPKCPKSPLATMKAGPTLGLGVASNNGSGHLKVTQN